METSEKLCKRDKLIVSLILKGYTVRQIAEETQYTVESVKTYKKQIYKKLGVHDKKELYKLVNSEKRS